MIKYDSHRWTSHLFDIRGSMVREIFGRVVLCVAWALLILALHYSLPQYMKFVVLPEIVHAIVGGSLSLLLVFRTNSSYDRFWEGRKLWGTITNESRTLARLTSVYLADHPAEVRQVLLWISASPYVFMHRLRGDKGFGPVASDLPTDEVQAVLNSRLPPLAVSVRISQLIELARREGRLTNWQHEQLEASLQRMGDAQGGCERIRSTQLPFAYAVHLRRILIMYCYSLPLALTPKYGLAMAPMVLLIAYTLFGIEEIGVEIEDPFGRDLNDLSLEQYCQSIEFQILGLAPAAKMTANS